jgi:transcriptional regulator EpsA
LYVASADRFREGRVEVSGMGQVREKSVSWLSTSVDHPLLPDTSIEAVLGILPTPADGPHLTRNEMERFMRIVFRSARVRNHRELFQLLQGDLQSFVPHQIMIGAWGNFFGGKLKLDVVSAIPGVRTEWLDGCTVEALLKKLHMLWLTNGRRPLFLDGATSGIKKFSGCHCALHRSLQIMQSVLVHGTHDARDDSDAIYVAIDANRFPHRREIERSGDLLDSIIAQIDVAFRRISEPEVSGKNFPRKAPALSARETEILAWVSRGRTNGEISKLLGISAFTVKNHVQRIIKKLGAANRAEAVANFGRLPSATDSTAGQHLRRKTDLNASLTAAD